MRHAPPAGLAEGDHERPRVPEVFGALMKLPTGIVGNIGLYYACYRLSALGWNVMPTARNTRGIDVVCFSVDGKTVRTIQVKSLTKADTVPLGTDLEKICPQKTGGPSLRRATARPFASSDRGRESASGRVSTARVNPA